jgi:hypothetical protein
MAQPWLNDPIVSGSPSAPPPWANDPIDKQAMLSRPLPNAPGGLMNAIKAGLESSASGLILRGKAPDVVLGKDASWYERAASIVAGTVADLPEMALGGLVGSAAGPVGSAAGAFAVPQAIRESLMQAYSQGGVHSWEDAWSVLKSGLTGGAEGALIGAATGGAGKIAEGLGAGMLVKGGAEVTAMVAAGDALQGRMPTAQDFLDAAIVIGGMHVAGGMAGKLRNIYAKTGVEPSQVVLDAARNPALKTELQTSEDLPSIYQPIAAEENAKAAVPDPQDRGTAVQFAQSPFARVAQAKGEPAAPTQVNYNYINVPDDVKGALSRLSELYDAKIQEQRRGTVSWEQTQSEAQALADTIGARIPNASVSSAEVLARKQLAVGAAEELVRQGKQLSQLGEAATPEQVTGFLSMVERSSMILSDFLGARAEAGRTLNVLKNTTKTALGAEDLLGILKSYGGKESVLDLADIIGRTDNPASALRAADAASRSGPLQMVLEGWRAGLISGPITWQAKTIGDVVGTFSQLTDRFLSATLSAGRTTDKVYMAEVPAMITGMMNGIMDGLKLAADTIMDRGQLTQPFEYKPGGAIPGQAGVVIRTPYRILEGISNFFATVNSRGEAYALATRKALNEGLTLGTNDFNSRVADLAMNDTDIAAAAKLAGEVATFTNKLGKIGRGIQNAVQGTPLAFVMPFIKTPANLIKWAAQRMPGVNLLMSDVRADLSGQNGVIARDKAIAHMVVGTAIATLAAEAVSNGTLTGGGIADPEKRKAMMAAGWQPYSIKINGTYYGYNRIEPVARLVSAVADGLEIYHAAENDAAGKMNIAGVVAAAIGNATISQTYLSGLANAVNAFTDPQRYGGRWLDQFAGSVVPAVVAQGAAAKDPYAREVNSIVDAVQARIPVWRENLLAKRNALTGEPIKAERLYPMSPVTTSEASTDPVLTEAARLGVSLPAAPREIHLGRGTGKLGKVEISPEARNAFTEEQGQFAHSVLTQIVNSPIWDVLPDIAKSNVYARVLTSARRNAALVALPPEARTAEAVRIANDVLEQSVQK